MKILLVEDNKSIIKGLEYAFTQNGYSCEYCVCCDEAIRKAPFDYDIAVLDITLPDGNGFDLYKKIRRFSDLPIIFLTAVDDEDSIEKSAVFENGQQIELTALEYKLLSLLMQNAGRVVTRELIFEKIWDISSNFVNDNTLTVYIKRIRKKLDADIIKTVKGMGYKVTEDGR